MVVLRWVMRHRWVVVVARVRDARLVRPARAAPCPRASCRPTTWPSSTSTCARRGHEPRRDAPHGRARRARDPRASRASTTPCHHRQRLGGDAEPGEHLRAPRRPARSARTTSSRSWTACARRSSRASPRTSASTSRRRRRSRAASRRRRSSTRSAARTSNQLARYTSKILERFRQVKGAVDVDSNLIVGNPEVHVEIDRERAGNLGVDVADVANALELLVGGLKVSTYEEGGDDYDIRARADAEYRADLAGISVMTVRPRPARRCRSRRS